MPLLNMALISAIILMGHPSNTVERELQCLIFKEMKPTIVGRTNKSMREVEREEVGEDSRGEDGVAVGSKEAIGEAYVGAVVREILGAGVEEMTMGA
ncbi:hypothetical protein J1N35_021187 [Gossypium stocksii]|uniref:Uncharacterized protein n=1 Tax=Gossypium stocksii TaxID=47602 RepID=A0A9D3ZZY5_9ROSI|nr:hypothetical protein J1N35_021187 [Gossypium stocksii]